MSFSPHIKYRWLYAIGITFITFLTLYPLISAGFLDWDDDNFVTNSKSITVIPTSTGALIRMFTTIVDGNYCPLSMLSYSLDYRLACMFDKQAGGLHPAMFHITSLLLHLANTLLVFFLVWRISNERILAAIIAATLFGIHPMHLESVAWIAERRDVLYTFFYLLGLLTYLKYRTKSEERMAKSENSFALGYYLLAVGFYLLSLFSKGQAITFPFAIIALDIIVGRKLDRKGLLEKIPFFILSFIFGWIAIIAQRSTYALHLIHVLPWQTPFTGAYGLLLYLIKAVVPYNLTGYHPYPFTDAAKAPFYLYAALPIMLAFLIFTYKRYLPGRQAGKADPYIFGGLFFFIFTILPVLQFFPVGNSIIAERYTYLPYIGLFFIAGYVLSHPEKYFTKAPKLFRGSSLLTISFFWIAILGFISYNHTKVWQNSIVFWTDVMDHYPADKLAYNNRGFIYEQQKQFDLALSDFNKGISYASYSPEAVRLYLNRGFLYNQIKKYDLALTDYNSAIGLDSAYLQAYINRGVIYRDVFNKYNLAISDFNKGISIAPGYSELYLDRGWTYNLLKQYNLALADYSTSIELDTTCAQTYIDRGIVYMNIFNKFELAISDFNKAISMAPGNIALYLGRGWSYSQLKQYDLALADYNTSIKIDTTYALAYIDRGIVYLDNFKQYNLALNDFRKAIKFSPQNSYRDEDILRDMAIAFYKKGVYDSAINYCNKALNIKPQGRIYWFLALIYSNEKDYTKAVQEGYQAKQMGFVADNDSLKNWKKGK